MWSPFLQYGLTRPVFSITVFLQTLRLVVFLSFPWLVTFFFPPSPLCLQFWPLLCFWKKVAPSLKAVFKERTKVLDSCIFALAPTFEKIPSHPFASLAAPPASRSHSSHIFSFWRFFSFFYSNISLLLPSAAVCTTYPTFFSLLLRTPLLSHQLFSSCLVMSQLLASRAHHSVSHPKDLFCFHFCLGQQDCHLCDHDPVSCRDDLKPSQWGVVWL